MKRDMELIRKMAMAIEEGPSGHAPDNLGIDGYASEQIGYHAHLMMQAGLADGIEMTAFGDRSPAAVLQSLTWQGHEFVRKSREIATAASAPAARPGALADNAQPPIP